MNNEHLRKIHLFFTQVLDSMCASSSLPVSIPLIPAMISVECFPESGSGCIVFFEGELVFDLQGLYVHLFENQDLSYQAFKQLVYSSSLNQDLAGMGGKVEIFRSSNKVDTSYYVLKKYVLKKNRLYF